MPEFSQNYDFIVILSPFLPLFWDIRSENSCEVRNLYVFLQHGMLLKPKTEPSSDEGGNAPQFSA